MRKRSRASLVVRKRVADVVKVCCSIDRGDSGSTTTALSLSPCGQQVSRDAAPCSSRLQRSMKANIRDDAVSRLCSERRVGIDAPSTLNSERSRGHRVDVRRLFCDRGTGVSRSSMRRAQEEQDRRASVALRWFHTQASVSLGASATIGRTTRTVFSHD